MSLADVTTADTLLSLSEGNGEVKNLENFFGEIFDFKEGLKSTYRPIVQNCKTLGIRNRTDFSTN
jgi:hypothetical protein